MVAHNAGARTTSSLYLFILFGLSLLMVAVILARIVDMQSQTAVKNDFQTYHSKKYQYSINYPSNWHLQSLPNDGNITTLSSFNSNFEGVGGSSSSASSKLPLSMSKIDILAFDVSAGTTAQALLNMQTGTVPEWQNSVSNIKLDHKDAMKVFVPTSSNLLDGNESSVTYNSVYLVSGTYGYIIAGYAEPALFNQILDSFHTN